MTYPFGAYAHVHVSERETAHRWPDGQLDVEGWEDCLWTGLVEIGRYAGLLIPASLTEAEALRAAAGIGPMAASYQIDAKRATEKRYGVTFDQGHGEDELLALPVGTAAVIAGSLGNFVRGDTLRRWDPAYTGGHAIVIFRVAGGTRWWWCDPLAPSGYTGQWVTDAQVRRFMYNGSSLFNHVRYGQFSPPPQETPMIPTNFAGKPVGLAKTIRPTSAFDLETRAPRPLPVGYERNVVAELTLQAELSASLPAGEPMLLVTVGDPDRFELIRESDTDWPAGLAKPKVTIPNCDPAVKTAVNAALDKVLIDDVNDLMTRIAGRKIR